MMRTSISAAFADFSSEVNGLANVRDYLLMFVSNLTITDLNNIILQSTTLAQLTASTNQLTRLALVMGTPAFVVRHRSLHL